MLLPVLMTEDVSDEKFITFSTGLISDVFDGCTCLCNDGLSNG